MIQAYLAEVGKDDNDPKRKQDEPSPAEERTKAGVRIISEPVIQPTP